MNVGGRPMRTIWLAADRRRVEIIDQTRLPHELVIATLATIDDAARAISTMQVRGAPLIGAAAAYGMALAMAADPCDAAVECAVARLAATRPTAVNLRWALDEMRCALHGAPPPQRFAAALARAGEIAEADVASSRAIGENGARLIEEAWRRRGASRPVEVLTHCNAGWLAAVDWGTALAPVYRAHDAGIPVHVWVDETRPRNQGASLTAWELGQHGVPHTVVVDNAGGHLMRQGLVDLCLVGTDRTAANGDVANKIGTYLKALAARDNDVPFWAAMPSSTIDWTLSDGVAEIPIEERGAAEVTDVTGRTADGTVTTVRVTPLESPAANPAFDVTQARLITGLITERGRCDASAAGLRGLFPDHAA